MKKNFRMHAVALSSILAFNSSISTLQVMASTQDTYSNDVQSTISEEGIEVSEDDEEKYVISDNAISPVVEDFTTTGENNPTIWIKDGEEVTLSSELERLINSAIQKNTSKYRTKYRNTRI